MHGKYLLISLVLLLFSANGAHAADWQTIDGQLHQRETRPKENRKAFLLVGSTWTDYEISIRVKPDCAMAGVYFRVGHPAELHAQSYDSYLWDISVTDDGGAGRNVIWGNFYTAWEGPTLIRNEWNELAVRVDGTSFTFFLNGEAVLELIDPSPSPILAGGIGLHTYTGSAWFDDLLVSDLQGATLAADDFSQPSDQWWFTSVDDVLVRQLQLCTASEAEQALYFKLWRVRHRPFGTYTLGFLGAAGLSPAAPSSAEFIQPGQCSPNLDVSSTVASDDSLIITAMGQSDAVAQVDLVSHIESEDGIVRDKTIQYREPTPNMVLVFPSDPASEVMVVEEIAADLLDFVSALPELPSNEGLFHISAGVMTFKFTPSATLLDTEYQVLRRMGYNTISASPTTITPEQLREYGFVAIASSTPYMQDATCSYGFDPDCLDEKMLALATQYREAGLLDYLDAFGLYDELGFDMHAMLDPERLYPNFDDPNSAMHHRWLLENAGLSKQDFLKEGVGAECLSCTGGCLRDQMYTCCTPEQDHADFQNCLRFGNLNDWQSDPQRLYRTAIMWSQNYQFRSSAITDAIERHFQKSDPNLPTVKTTANIAAYHKLTIGPAPDMDPFGLVNPRTEVPAMEIPASVDYFWASRWGTMGAEENSFLGAVLRGASRRQALEPTITVASQTGYLGGNTNIGIRLGVYGGLLQGMKRLRYFLYGPRYGATENYFSDDKTRVSTVHDINRSIAMVDELLYHGTVRRAPIAIVMSLSDDIWNKIHIADDTGSLGSDSHVFFMERRSLFFALRHAGFPVDIVSEQDVADGWLSEGGYQVIYLSASHLHHAATERLKEWVAQGGVLVSTGGALLDEYNHPDNTLNDVYGIEHSTLRLDQPIIYYEILPGLESIETITLLEPSIPLGELAVFGYAQSIEIDEEAAPRILGTYSDGSPAIIAHEYGDGVAYLVGATPGVAYIKTGWGRDHTYTRDLKAAPFNPVGFDTSIRDLITYPLMQAGTERHVWFEGGLLLEGNIIETEDTLVIPLANFQVAPQHGLTVYIADPREVIDIVSLELGPLSHSRDGAHIVIEDFSIELTDMLVVRLGEEWVELEDADELIFSENADEPFGTDEDRDIADDMLGFDPDDADDWFNGDIDGNPIDFGGDQDVTEDPTTLDSTPLAEPTEDGGSQEVEGCGCVVSKTARLTHPLLLVSIGLIGLVVAGKRRRTRKSTTRIPPFLGGCTMIS